MSTTVVPALAGRDAAVGFARAALYRVLAAALAYPTAGRVALLTGPRLAEAHRAAPRLGDDLVRATRDVRVALAGLDRASAERAHLAVFGHAAAQRVAPYEAPYLTTNLFQETDALADVAGFYRAFGVEPSASERADHVVLELEFMQLLAFKEGHARRRHGPTQVTVVEEAERAFLAAHLGRWGVAFFRGLAAAAEGSHYVAVAGLGERFLASEAARAGVVPRLAPPRPPLPNLDDGPCPLTEAAP